MWNHTPKNRERWAQMQRNDAFLRQQKCHYCSKAVRRANWSENYNGPDLATVHHVIPLARGGTNRPTILQTWL
jgi:5-methylcytosine-specific restriction endonuclease McrA